MRGRGRGRVRVRVRVRVMVRDSYPNPNSPTFSWCRPPAPPLSIGSHAGMLDE